VISSSLSRTTVIIVEMVEGYQAGGSSSVKSPAGFLIRRKQPRMVGEGLIETSDFRLTMWAPSKPCGTNSCTSAMDQSGVPTSCRGVLVFEPLPVSGVLGAGTGDAIREAAVLGWKGAAFAALGEMGFDFLGPDTPLPDKMEGVKLGESTLKRFLLLN
jgi:hypothetical protein